MSFDFTLSAYQKLCLALKELNRPFIRFQDFFTFPLKEKVILLRHDVDRWPKNALEMAFLEHSLGIQSTYYFRYTRHVFKKDIIREISKLGHEIGFHYETLAQAKGCYQTAIQLFKEQLEKFREVCDIQTICMHGSPLSKFDNRTLWDHFDLKDFSIRGEVYKDIDYSEVAYFTDTGRTWGETTSNLRDRVNFSYYNKKEVSTTFDVIKFLPFIKNSFIIQTHPERWNTQSRKYVFYFLIDNLSIIIKKIYQKINFK